MSLDTTMNTYGRQEVSFVSGDGAWLVDDKGKRYLDALSGIGVVALGHAHPEISRTLAEQSGRLLHTSNLYRIPQQEELADELVRLSGLSNVFFANSGARTCHTLPGSSRP